MKNNRHIRSENQPNMTSSSSNSSYDTVLSTICDYTEAKELLAIRGTNKAFKITATQSLLAHSHSASLKYKQKLLHRYGSTFNSSVQQQSSGFIINMIKQTNFSFLDRIDALFAIATKEKIHLTISKEIIDKLLEILERPKDLVNAPSEEGYSYYNALEIFKSIVTQLDDYQIARIFNDHILTIFDDDDLFKRLSRALKDHELENAKKPFPILYIKTLRLLEAMAPRLNKEQIIAVIKYVLIKMRHNSNTVFTHAKSALDQLLPSLNHDELILIYENEFGGLRESKWYEDIIALKILSIFTPYLNNEQLFIPFEALCNILQNNIAYSNTFLYQPILNILNASLHYLTDAKKNDFLTRHLFLITCKIIDFNFPHAHEIDILCKMIIQHGKDISRLFEYALNRLDRTQRVFESTPPLLIIKNLCPYLNNQQIHRSVKSIYNLIITERVDTDAITSLAQFLPYLKEYMPLILNSLVARTNSSHPLPYKILRIFSPAFSKEEILKLFQREFNNIYQIGHNIPSSKLRVVTHLTTEQIQGIFNLLCEKLDDHFYGVRRAAAYCLSKIAPKLNTSQCHHLYASLLNRLDDEDFIVQRDMAAIFVTLIPTLREHTKIYDLVLKKSQNIRGDRLTIMRALISTLNQDQIIPLIETVMNKTTNYNSKERTHIEDILSNLIVLGKFESLKLAPSLINQLPNGALLQNFYEWHLQVKKIVGDKSFRLSNDLFSQQKKQAKGEVEKISPPINTYIN